MEIEEAIVYVLASSGYGMKTEQIAREIHPLGQEARGRQDGVRCGDVASGYIR